MTYTAAPTPPAPTSLTHRQPVLRPRTLITQLFAEALAGDLRAEDDLRWLAVYDTATAAAAYEALVVGAHHSEIGLRADSVDEDSLWPRGGG